MKQMVPGVSDPSQYKYQAMAGGLTGLIEHSIMYPVDFVKTRMQVLMPRPKARYINIRSCIATILKDEGANNFFRGMPAPIFAVIPAHAAYCVTYETFKRRLSGTTDGYYSPSAQGIAGALAVIAYNAVQNPADVIKQRMQVHGSVYKSTFQCFNQILYLEGAKAFYRSLPTQLVIDAPYTSIHFVIYEFCQNFMNPPRTFDAASHVLSGALAGGIAATATNPLDVCKTLINTQEPAILRKFRKSFIKGLPSAIRIVYRTHGLHGFFRGLTARVFLCAPSMALCWVVYEYFKMYFSEKDTPQYKHQAMAGGLTGLIEYSIMYPVDFIKTRMQVLIPRPEAEYKNIISCIATILKDEGAHKFFRGMPVPICASIPAHAAYYVTYEQCKRKLSGTSDGYYSPLSQGVAGALAVIAHNAFQNPADVIKQRMQVHGSVYKSSFQCFNEVLHLEGVKAFYRSFPTQLVIDAPYGSIHFIIYEFCQNLMNPTRTFDATSHVLSGAFAGGIAAAATNPLDVCRTLINTQEPTILENMGKSFIKGLPSAIRIVYSVYGMSGFFRGITPRVLHNAPSMALCWVVYEFFKRYFFEKDKLSSTSKI